MVRRATSFRIRNGNSVAFCVFGVATLCLTSQPKVTSGSKTGGTYANLGSSGMTGEGGTG